MPQSGDPPTSMELTLVRSGDEILVSAQASLDRRTKARPLGEKWNMAAVRAFTASVRRSAERGKGLRPELLADAQALQQAMLAGEIGQVYAVLRSGADGRLVVRLVVDDPELQAVPWEALCNSGEALGFWANSLELFPVRGVTSSDPWEPCAVSGAVRVLAISPTGDRLEALKLALAARIEAGEVEWLDPVVGEAATNAGLRDRLRKPPIPHVLHFLGHGGLKDDKPVLQLAEEDGDERWLQVELFAKQLKSGFKGKLRLVILEACEGARPSDFSSAAETFAKIAGAAVAHLWPVKMDVARLCSKELYSALAAEGRGGDIALALNEARLAILSDLENTAEAFSPVLYLRGAESVLFDFKARAVVAPPVARPTVLGAAEPAAIDSDLVRLLRAPFSLVLGDQGRKERLVLDGLADRLVEALTNDDDPPRDGLPLSALAQRYTFRLGADELRNQFQLVSRQVEREAKGRSPNEEPGEERANATVPPLVAALARFAGPGVHTTLLRSPLFEQALADGQRSLRIDVFQPGDAGPTLICREPGKDWRAPREALRKLDLDREAVVLRLYRGVTPQQVFTPPLLTEDDYLFAPRDLEAALPPDPRLAYEIRRALQTRPALLLGLSLLSWDHRVLLHRLFSEGSAGGSTPKGFLPFGSLVLLEAGSSEVKLWKTGAGLPGGKGVTVVEAQPDALARLLQQLPGLDGAIDVPPAPPRSAAPTRPSLRQLLRAVLKSDADLDGFCLDYFASTHARFSGGMETVAKVNILLQREDASAILSRLQAYDAAAVARHGVLLEYEP
jgi:CHAT domain